MRSVVRTNKGHALVMRLEYLLSRWQLVAALAWSVKDEAPFADEEEEVDPREAPALVKLSRAEAWRRVTQAVRDTGSGYTWWSDGLDEEWADAVQAWAEREVRRCFAPLFLAAGDPDPAWPTPLIDLDLAPSPLDSSPTHPH